MRLLMLKIALAAVAILLQTSTIFAFKPKGEKFGTTLLIRTA